MVEAQLKTRILEEFSGLERISDLLTAQEHKLVASTVEMKYEEMPYTPIAVVDGVLSADDCQRAREMLESYACVGFYWGKELLTKDGSNRGLMSLPRLDLEEGETHGETLWDPRLLNKKDMNYCGTMEDLSRNFPFERKYDPFKEIKKGIDASKLLTYQERVLIGSYSQNQLYLDNPHTPRGFLDGLLSIEECNELRKRMFFVDGLTAPGYFGKDGEGIVKLVQLDAKTGMTVCDPILLNKDELEDADSEFDYNNDFPYQREVA